MSTPHIGANPGDIAPVMLMPGDPLRAKYIAEHYLSDAVCFNEVRNMLGYTGFYGGKRISVMGHGMGIPSIGIYVSELMQFFGVKTIIRIGTSGAQQPQLHVGDVVLGQGCCTTSDMNHYVFPGTYAPVADYDLLRTAYEKAKAAGQRVAVGNISSGDMFYPPAKSSGVTFADFGCLANEMEGAALYTIAKKYGCRALCIVTISDSSFEPDRDMTSQQREQSLNDMIRLGLDTAISFA